MGFLMHAQFSAATRVNWALRGDDSRRRIVRLRAGEHQSGANHLQLCEHESLRHISPRGASRQIIVLS